jgi:hypothetical protein
MMNPSWNDTVSGDELRRRQAEIDQAMLGVIADARRSNPNAHELPIKVLPAGATEAKVGVEPPRRGWQEERPLESPMRTGSFVESVVGGMIDQAFPPSPAEQLARIKAQLRALTSAQREQLLKECDASGPKGAELKALAEEAWR